MCERSGLVSLPAVREIEFTRRGFLRATGSSALTVAISGGLQSAAHAAEWMSWGHPVSAQGLMPKLPISLPFASFQKNTNGSWSPLQDVSIPSPTGALKLARGTSIMPGVPLQGLDISKMLNEQCSGTAPPSR
jgi:hypothetical protein